MDRQCQRGSVSKMKRCTTGIGMCERQKEMEEICSCSQIISNLQVKMHRSKKKKDIPGIWRATNVDISCAPAKHSSGVLFLLQSTRVFCLCVYVSVCLSVHAKAGKVLITNWCILWWTLEAIRCWWPLTLRVTFIFLDKNCLIFLWTLLVSFYVVICLTWLCESDKSGLLWLWPLAFRAKMMPARRVCAGVSCSYKLVICCLSVCVLMLTSMAQVITAADRDL